VGWKIYFAVMGLLSAFGWAGTIQHAAKYGAVTWVHFPVDALSLVGLFGYAFRRELLTAWVWRAVALFVLALLPFDLSVMIHTNAARPVPYGVGIAGLAFAFQLVMVAPMVFALLKYGQRLGATRTDQGVSA
jgi:hypothetical protein